MVARPTVRVPPYFGLEVTRRCNLRCPHCYTASGADVEPGASTEALGQLLVELGALGLRRLALTGGEPLLRDDLEQLMKRGRAAGIEGYSLVTNGTLVTARRAKSLRAAGLRSVQISVDGADSYDHRRVRACSELAFYRALRAVRLFREAGVRVDVAAILNARNAQRAAESLALVQALGARWLRYCSFVPTGRAADPTVSASFDVDPVLLDRFFERLRGWRAQAGERLAVLVDHGIGPWASDERLVCQAGRRIAYVAASGDLYPCTGLLFEPFKVGNVFTTPLVELLRSPKMHAARAIRRAELGEPCGSCDVPSCSGGCRGAAYAATGDAKAGVRYCNVLRRRQASHHARTDEPGGD